MQLTEEQLKILNHTMIDGQVWADNAKDEHVLASIAKRKQLYLNAKASLGDNYKTRKQREDEIEQQRLDEYNNVPYNIKRRREYPSVGDQLDKIYHEGIDKWKEDMIKPVKDKHPKA